MHLQRSVADMVARRTGRFFWTNGVEYSAWPIAALLQKESFTSISIDNQGSTRANRGPSNISLYNPGKEQIQKFIKDVDQERKHAPLNNFTMCNLMAEGMLLAKSLFPEELAPYEFNEVNYLRKTMSRIEEASRDGCGRIRRDG